MCSKHTQPPTFIPSTSMSSEAIEICGWLLTNEKERCTNEKKKGDATKIANSIIKKIRIRVKIWHQIFGGVERAVVKSGKTHLLHQLRVCFSGLNL